MKNKMKNENVYPEDGGCWFCFKQDETLVFDTEFDTFVHIDCIKKALEKDPKNLEAGAMKYLLNTEQESTNSDHKCDYDNNNPLPF